MISVEAAKERILKHTKPLRAVSVSLENALGSILSESISSPVNLPPFDQSAMDGYAVRARDFQENKTIRISGEVAAGSVLSSRMAKASAVRIFTGAPIPSGADAVLMQEKISVHQGYLHSPEILPSKGDNIRKKGSQIKAGQTALRKGTQITPGTIGFLSAMGITHVKVFAKPRIKVLVTGTELTKPGNKLGPGQIFESNSYALNAAIQSLGNQSTVSIQVADDAGKTRSALQKALKSADLVLVTGGISVGDYDFVGTALSDLGVKNIFYKIRQKPGKPLFFGKLDQTIVFGLPGNPAAVLSCFYEYVYPALKKMEGNPMPMLKTAYLPLSEDFKKKPGLSLFLKGKISHNAVSPLKGQESYILSSFSEADCLIYIPEERGNIQKGEPVEIHLLPGLY